MNWPPRAFIHMKVGPHGGETLDAILCRKNRELECAGKIFWGYGGSTCNPKTQVQPFVKEWIQKQGSVYVLMEEVSGSGPSVGARAGTATHYSVSGDEWRAIPKGILTGPPRALVLGKIEPVCRKLDLRDFEVGVGRSKGKNAVDYIKYRADKGCFVSARSSSDHPSRCITIRYQARLLDPYAVFLSPWALLTEKPSDRRQSQSGN